MSAANRAQTTNLLTRAQSGDVSAAEQLAPQIYEELRRLAAAYLRSERADHTLQPTALVHEAYLRLIDASQVEWRDRAHFFRAAARAMRRVLVDHARAHRAEKRAGSWQRITLAGVDPELPGPNLELLALDELLEQLAALHERHAQIVELRFFGGLTIAETASALGVSETTVEDDWAMARAWLQLQLNRGDAHGP
ncbi:MAG: sigma-70 family RNA polymerase sigma factor [Phycisphaerae bacterium]|jgi:RNA polymerase sigma factor (TIGR02999 family)